MAHVGAFRLDFPHKRLFLNTDEREWVPRCFVSLSSTARTAL